MSQPVNLLEANPNEVKEFLQSFDYVFSDCDGVLWTKSPLPGSGDFIQLMKEYGKTIHFVSNNSLRSKEEYEALFKALNIESGYDNLTVPSTAIACYLKSSHLNKKVFCVACKETVNVLRRNGFKCFEGPNVGVDNYEDYVQYLQDDEDVGAVVFDSDFKVNIPKLYMATTYLKRPEVIFLSGATDKKVPFRPGLKAFGTAAFTDIVAMESQREPVLLGKPGKTFGEFAMKRAGATDPSRVLFIGDMINQDIGLGKALGFKTLLVLTNTSREEMLAEKTLMPDFYAPSLGSLVPLLKNK